ncbi:MAG: preprotein translocase subunit SecG [Parcubacteria group bacterium]|nr:preprotein translocase subunit SecG [Parcubacteria group bacterium]
MLINIIQVVLGILLGTVILLQQQGGGLSGAFGGEGEFHHTKRGAEKFLFVSTIVLAVLFFSAAIANIIL